MQDLVNEGIFKPEQVDTYTQKLIQMGVKQSNVSDLMHSMAAATVGSSGSLEEANGKMNTLTTMFGYMQDKGGLTVSMLGRFSKSLGIPIIDTMAQSLGMTTEQFEAMKGSSAVTADMMQKAFDTMATGSGKFSKSLSADSNTLEARQSALGTQFDSLKLSVLGMSDTGDVVKGGFYDKISTATSNLITFIQKHKVAMDALLVVIGTSTIGVGLLIAAFVLKTLTIGLSTLVAIAHTVATTAATVATGLWAAATWVLNAALIVLTSPIFLVILAIAAVIAIGVLLITHWKEVQAVAKTVFDAVGTFFTNLGTTVHGIVNTIIADVKNMVNSIIGGINTLINGANTVGSKIGLGAIKIPNIPTFDQGGWVPQTGIAVVHQGEFVLSRDMIAGRAPTPAQISNTKQYNQPINIQANVANDMDMNVLGQRLAFELRNTR